MSKYICDHAGMRKCWGPNGCDVAKPCERTENQATLVPFYCGNDDCKVIYRKIELVPVTSAAGKRALARITARKGEREGA
jgi:hypothetical protein